MYDGEDLPDTYVKVTLNQQMRVTKSKKTSLIRRTLTPAFNQSFDIKLTGKCVGVAFLTVQLKQARLFALKGHIIWLEYFSTNLQHSDLTLGSVIIGSAMFARHSGLKQWERALSCTKQHIVETHVLNTPAGAKMT